MKPKNETKKTMKNEKSKTKYKKYHPKPKYNISDVSKYCILFVVVGRYIAVYHKYYIRYYYKGIIKV